MSGYFSTTDSVRRWCSEKEIAKIEDGLVRNMDALDLAAIREGQSEKKMRGYSRKPRIWDLPRGSSAIS